MIFKYAFIAFLGVVLYRLVLPKKKIDVSSSDRKTEEEFTDYEEIEE